MLAWSGDILRARKVTQLLHRVFRARCPLIPWNKARRSDKDAVMESGSSHQHELDVDVNVNSCWRGVGTSCGATSGKSYPLFCLPAGEITGKIYRNDCMMIWWIMLRRVVDGG